MGDSTEFVIGQAVRKTTRGAVTIRRPGLSLFRAMTAILDAEAAQGLA
jgi:hypothetical protein